MKGLLVIFVFSVFLFQSKSVFGCDGMSITVLSNEYLGNGQYQVTLQYCESVSNGANAATYGIIVQLTGANATGTTTPSFTSNATGATINYNQVNGNTVQWGNWNNNPAGPVFLPNGNAVECFTMVIQTDGPVTSVSVGGSSASTDEGAGFVSWMGRWTCRMTTAVPPVICSSAWTAPTLCAGDNTLVDLYAFTSSSGVFSGTGVDSGTGVFNPALATFPASITLTVGDGGFNCQTTHDIDVIDLVFTNFADPNVCAGQSVQLDGSLVGGNAGNVFSWTPTDAGLSNVNIHNPTATPTETTTYTVTVTNTASGCQATNDITVNYDIPDVPVFNSLDEHCQFETAPVLPTTSLNGITGSWTPVVSTNTAGTFDYTFTADAVGTCVPDPIVLSLTVNPLPTVDAGEDQVICMGEDITLTGSGTAVNYTWDNGVTDDVSFTPNSSETYTVIGVDANGCENTDVVTINVENLPVIEAGENQVICIGESVVLSASGGNNYVWSNSVIDGVAFSPNQTVTYTVTYTSPNGCVGSDQVTVTVNPLPNITANNIVGCDGDAIVLNGNGGVTYQWDNGVINGQPFVPGLGVTNYNVIGTDANGCENFATATVVIHSYPNAAFSVTPITGAPPLEVTVTNESSGTITDYWWSFDNGNTSTENFNQYTTSYHEQGNPTITLTVSNEGCDDTFSVTLDVKFLPIEYLIPNVFTPNNDGNNDSFHLSLLNVADIELIIFNRWGNVMAEITDVNHPGWDGRTPSGSEASEGVYFHKYRIKGLNGEEVEGHGFLHLQR